MPEKSILHVVIREGNTIDDRGIRGAENDRCFVQVPLPHIWDEQVNNAHICQGCRLGSLNLEIFRVTDPGSVHTFI